MTATIRVSVEVRDRLTEQAGAASRTPGQQLDHLADLGDREMRLTWLQTTVPATPVGDLVSDDEEGAAWDRIEGD